MTAHFCCTRGTKNFEVVSATGAGETDGKRPAAVWLDAPTDATGLGSDSPSGGREVLSLPTSTTRNLRPSPPSVRQGGDRKNHSELITCARSIFFLSRNGYRQKARETCNSSDLSAIALPSSWVPWRKCTRESEQATDSTKTTPLLLLNAGARHRGTRVEPRSQQEFADAPWRQWTSSGLPRLAATRCRPPTRNGTV